MWAAHWGHKSFCRVAAVDLNSGEGASQIPAWEWLLFCQKVIFWKIVCKRIFMFPIVRRKIITEYLDIIIYVTEIIS